MSLNSVIATRSVHITNSSLSRSVVGCVHGGRGLLVNRHATRRVGVRVNSTGPCSSRGDVRVGKHGRISNLPGGVVVSSRRMESTVSSAVCRVVSIVHLALRGAPPRLTTSVVSQNVALANNNTLLHNLTRLVTRRANVPIAITTGPVSYIILNATGHLRTNSNFRGCIFHHKGRFEWCLKLFFLLF